MEQTTLQQRIEERAKQSLLEDLVAATNRENENVQLFGSNNYSPQLDARWYHSSYDRSKVIKMYNDFTKQLFEKMLPRYVTEVTDQILQKIDEIDFLIADKKEQEADY